MQHAVRTLRPDAELRQRAHSPRDSLHGEVLITGGLGFASILQKQTMQHLLEGKVQLGQCGSLALIPFRSIAGYGYRSGKRAADRVRHPVADTKRISIVKEVLLHGGLNRLLPEGLRYLFPLLGRELIGDQVVAEGKALRNEANFVVGLEAMSTEAPRAPGLPCGYCV